MESNKKKWFKFDLYRNKKEQKFVFHWYWNVPHIPFECIEYAIMPKRHQLVFSGADNNYWLFYKSEGKYKWFVKTINDHTQCA